MDLNFESGVDLNPDNLQDLQTLWQNWTSDVLEIKQLKIQSIKFHFNNLDNYWELQTKDVA